MDNNGQQWTTMDNNPRCYMHLWCPFYDSQYYNSRACARGIIATIRNKNSHKKEIDERGSLDLSIFLQLIHKFIPFPANCPQIYPFSCKLSINLFSLRSQNEMGIHEGDSQWLLIYGCSTSGSSASSTLPSGGWHYLCLNTWGTSKRTMSSLHSFIHCWWYMDENLDNDKVFCGRLYPIQQSFHGLKLNVYPGQQSFHGLTLSLSCKAICHWCYLYLYPALQSLHGLSLSVRAIRPLVAVHLHRVHCTPQLCT